MSQTACGVLCDRSAALMTTIALGGVAGAEPRDVVIKEQPVLAFDRTRYECKRMFATAPDKTKVPERVLFERSDALNNSNADVD